MAIANGTRVEKNIWIAAGDGDLDRVRELIETQGLSPNSPDPFTYTPMHAAASYGHIHILTYLIERGGNVDVTDEDGDTPLYTVENVDTARFLVERGATVNRNNNEGVTPIAHLSEDFPDVAEYLRTVALTAHEPSPTGLAQPSQYAENIASERLTSTLMATAQEVIQRAEAEGRDPDEELRQVVGRTVLEGMITGYGLGMQAETQERGGGDHDPASNGVKRPRTDEGSG